MYSFTIMDDTTKNRMAFTQNLRYTYNVCEGARDSIGFVLRDTLASSQSIPDTLEYKLINDVPASRLWVKDSLAREPEIHLVWTAPENGYHNNPYTLNLYAHEKLCDPNRAYLFRSAEFNVVPRPRFAIQADTTLCGKLHFKALNLLGSGTYKYRWYVYSKTDTIKTSLYAADSILLPYPGKWYLSLEAENAQFGCKSRFADSVETFYAGMGARILNKTTGACKGEQLWFHGAQTNAAGTWSAKWYVNGSLASDSLHYASKIQDTLYVKLILSDQRGCLASDSVRVSPFRQMQVQPIHDTAFCHNSGIYISALLPTGADSLEWLHNGSKTALQYLSKADSYTLRYTDSNACTVQDTFVLKQVPSILPYTFGDVRLCRGDSFRPLFASGPGIVYDSLHWLSGGTVLSRSYNPVLAVKANGLIVLKAWGRAFGLQCSQSDTFALNAYPDSVAFASSTPDTCFSTHRTSVQLSGALKGIVHWGDGLSDSITDAGQHRYTAAGTYAIKAYSFSANNCPDTFSASVRISPSAGLSISLSDSVQCLNGNQLTLNIASGSAAVQHRCDWGDGNTGTLPGSGTLTHRYDSLPNTYTPRRIVVYGQLYGCTDTASATLQLHPHPELGILTEGLCLGDSTYIEAALLNAVPVKTYNWYTDGSAEGQQQRFARLFTGKLTYALKVEAASDQDCRGESSKTLQLTEKPEADFTYTSLGAKDGGQLYYFINRSIGSNAWLWYFAGTDTSMTKNPEYLFTDTGFKQVLLVASKDNICFDTATQWVPVYSKLEFYFPNVFSPNGNGSNDGFGLSRSQWFMVKEYRIAIYNRWGEKVFDSDSHEQLWTGDKAQQGIYIWKADIRDIYNILHEYKGVVEVLK